MERAFGTMASLLTAMALFFSTGISLQKHKVNAIGNFNGLVILASFPDMGFHCDSPAEEFDSLLNAVNSPAAGSHGSVRTYFLDNSGGKFRPSFDIIGPVTLPHDVRYYGENDSTGNDMRSGELVTDALEACPAKVDFSRYDNNRDGTVDMVYVIYAGWGEQFNRKHPEYIWPKAGEQDSTTVRPGVAFGRYAISCELAGNRDLPDSLESAGVGTFCHEFSHILGLPDVYNTKNGSGMTPGSFDLMDRGNYLDGQHTPCNYSCVEKEMAGWIRVQVLKPGDTMALAPLCEAVEDTTLRYCCKVETKTPGESYYLEYRTTCGWDAFLPSSGILVYRIDVSNPELWDKNEVNGDYLHQCYSLIRYGGPYCPDSTVAFSVSKPRIFQKSRADSAQTEPAPHKHSATDYLEFVSESDSCIVVADHIVGYIVIIPQ
ncbi:MAG: M6 family metalloprotease domain-containing protein [Bacteroidales bacterium]|jgi:M6 family metalloprotease-like protein|nr:M6 family metalloprotease domain-containing protein [Bacteroidales bacterium]MCI2122288.1 M6 family metalloprotease domain-containing protein [Bacteroidales bacterium]MCI2145751.1 M6 family metalloprotease domain-containing protein [Bacteroidales bacterium]